MIRARSAGGALRVGQFLPQRGAHLLQVLKQRPALGAVLGMPLDIGGGDCIDLAVEVRLHAKRFSALHSVLLRPLAATVP